MMRIFGFIYLLVFTVLTYTTVAEVVTEKPTRVYFIYSPEDDLWLHQGNDTPIKLIGWKEQNQASVWTVRKDAERVKNSMLGRRANQSEIKAFLIVPASDDA